MKLLLYTLFPKLIPEYCTPKEKPHTLYRYVKSRDLYINSHLHTVSVRHAVKYFKPVKKKDQTIVANSKGRK